MDAAARDLVRQRAGNRCEYCLLPEEVDEWPFHIEHIVARQHGGDDTSANLCWACSRCNLYKGTNLASMDPETNEIAALFNPRKDQWKHHFAFHDVRIIGITPSGRATARLLHFNDSRRIDLRSLLIKRGFFVI